MTLLALLQLVDTSFPSGAYTLSHGLESLVLDGVVRDADTLVEAIGTQLVSRLARADLPATAASVAGGAGHLGAMDRALVATKLAAEERAGSRRVGRRIVDEVARLVDDERLAGYGAEVRDGSTPGCSAVAFGVAAGAMGIAMRDAVTGAASSFVMGQAAAAVRLALVGHREAQLVIRRCAPVIEHAVDIALLSDPLDPRPSAPAIDIAIARHETAPVRMFAS
jgi:urease accessory protein